ncbi:CsgE family curli-type amyloid fiber assembly protein [Flavobacterium pygoscelis]|uniref:CsgE family curli-type amyloid fiber assembly protein n=1 Tax=Flavobacterium pygoscelis TaxID=2893176 RepID=UPI0031F46D6D
MVIPSDGFELIGIISDDTKTKVGKDFYDVYYYLYNQYKVNSKKIITLNEEFSFARNTKIVVSIDNEVIYEFLARPDEEYLKEMAEESIYATYLYLKNLEKQSKYFTQY